jgi:TRAP-type C4-dicarboxylate transport system, periplasmic component
MIRRLAILAAAMLIGGTAQAATTLNLSSYVPTSHPLVSEGMAEWAKEVEKATQGRVTVRILATPLGKPEAHFDMARDGIADIALGIPGYTPGRFVLVDVAGVPGLANSGVALSVGLWKTFAASPEMQKEFEGVKPLGVFTTSPMQFFNTKREIKTVDDFKGMKTRSAGGLMTDIVSALGMVPLLQPAGKSYELLSSGVADAVINPQEAVKSLKLEQLVKYGTIIPGGLTAAPIFLVMNPAKFNGLSKADQDAVMSVSGERLSRIVGAVWDRHDKNGLETLKAAGGAVSTASPELAKRISEAAEPVVAAWAANAKDKRAADGQAILTTLRAEVAKAEAQ